MNDSSLSYLAWASSSISPFWSCLESRRRRRSIWNGRKASGAQAVRTASKTEVGEALERGKGTARVFGSWHNELRRQFRAGLSFAG